MKKYLSLIYLICPIIAIILMIIPSSVALLFEGEGIGSSIIYYSFFDSRVAIYGNIGPLIASIGAVAILLATVLYIVINKDYVIKTIFVMYIVAIGFSMYNAFYSIELTTILGWIIPAILIIGALLLAPKAFKRGS